MRTHYRSVGNCYLWCSRYLTYVTFNTVKDLNTHWLYHTGLMYKCKKCNKTVYTPSTWKFHNYCQKPKLYQCNTCHKKFMYSSKMRQHRHIHITQKHFKCFHGGCSKTYKHPQDLEWNAVTHLNTKFECVLCEKSFNQWCLLKRHEVVHSNVLKYFCTTCEIGFKHYNQLYWHKNKNHWKQIWLNPVR